ncbi:MAG TPA: DUF4064 domain-containing protein [Pseudogracilibacillus sp.]|nr:DUF4064 domain-containing protein [Pseudogracilibacillus sp.]
MKRTGEVTLSIIGFVLSFIGTLIVAAILLFSNNDNFRIMFEEGFMEGSMEEGLQVNPGDAQLFLNFLLGLGWIALIVLLVSTVLGIIAMYFFIGNKKPVAASVVILIAAIIIIVGTALAGVVPGVLYLIAGIMGLVRRPPITDTPHVSETTLHWDQNNPDKFN